MSVAGQETAQAHTSLLRRNGSPRELVEAVADAPPLSSAEVELIEEVLAYLDRGATSSRERLDEVQRAGEDAIAALRGTRAGAIDDAAVDALESAEGLRARALALRAELQRLEVAATLVGAFLRLRAPGPRSGSPAGAQPA